ncbi:fungal specific transcription factor domain-containing protein [Ophiocordyceps camponoti-floridani]|uniref:Fungal specific transcription factor domain-containing protein n=1 Tax=Ophiocordyceps camponoti-floridani TaxID=2030778 RepID=A0A8H4QDF4_9HYPO|nr:fungal specific transcription factor domain-containing protein [Ophiocordyceps camponoti-floridani]
MEQIETQASDLRVLAQTQQSDSACTPQQQASPPPLGSGFGDDPGHFGKRKADDGGAKQTRSKRNRYISIACNECKRRKIKCNGETPCQRCGNLNLACLYAPNCCANNFRDSDEFKSVIAQLRRLQDDVVRLNQTVSIIRTGSARSAPAAVSHEVVSSPPQASSISTRQRPRDWSASSSAFIGSTSTAFNLDVANNTIANMGYRCPDDASEPEHQSSEITAAGSAHFDPLFEFPKDEMLRLCQFYQDEIGIMYPVIDIPTVTVHARTLADLMAEARSQQRPLETINDAQTLKLKLVLCCALVVEQHGHSEEAARMYESMDAVLNRKLMADASDVTNLPILILLAGYRLLSMEEVLAWRVIGHVVRLCVELGIHQKRGLMGIADEAERTIALNSFWTAFVLDRRWGFAAGLPFTLQDDEIDPELPFPGSPFLVAMITYSRLGAKVWRQVSHFGPVLARELRQQEIEDLDHEILHWYETVPEEIKVRNWAKEKSVTTYDVLRKKIWTYLRFNQLRIWLYTPILHSATSIMSNPLQAQRAVDLARDMIQYLHHLNTTTNMYRVGQVFYHKFLASAIAVVFLASVHAPVRFSDVCRHEFYVALDMVRDLSAKSWVSKRLWRTVKSLKDVAPRFGLGPDIETRSAAALRMTTYPTLSPSAPPQQGGHSPWSFDNGKELHMELSKIFEDHVGSNAGHQSALASSSSSSGTGGDNFAAVNSVYRELREML